MATSASPWRCTGREGPSRSWCSMSCRRPPTDLVAAGAKAARSVAELARESRIIGICVRDDKEVEQLLSGSGGILENARPDTVVAIHSTVKQESIFAWHERGKSKSIHIIDASVTRATEPGKFCYMLGGSCGARRALPPAAPHGRQFGGPRGSRRLGHRSEIMQQHDDLRVSSSPCTRREAGAGLRSRS